MDREDIEDFEEDNLEVAKKNVNKKGGTKDELTLWSVPRSVVGRKRKGRERGAGEAS